jgi:hypothetical protein
VTISPARWCRSRPGKALATQAGPYRGSPSDATDPCRRWGGHGLVDGSAGPGSTGPSPRGRSGGVTSAQAPPAATGAIRHSHRPLPREPGGPSSPPWLATTGPAPPPTAPCRVPDTAGRRGCRTAARSCGRPGSANRRSAGCTERSRWALASRYMCGPCRTPSLAGWRSPRAGGSSGRSRGVTALGRVARLRPTHQAGGHGQLGAASRFHRTPRRSGSPARSGCGRRPSGRRHRARLLRQGLELTGGNFRVEVHDIVAKSATGRSPRSGSIGRTPTPPTSYSPGTALRAHLLGALPQPSAGHC